MANAPIMSFAVPNYSGLLYTKSNTQTPFINLIAEPQYTNHVQFAVDQEYSLDTPSQPAISEQASMTAPDTKKITRTQHTNVTQIYQRACEISYAKESNMGTMSGINIAGQQANPGDEWNWQISRQMLNIANDIEFTSLQGEYNAATTDATVNKSRGILTALTTNVIDAKGSGSTAAALTKAMIKSRVKSIFDNGGDVNGMILMCNSFQKAAISALYEGSMQMPDSRMEAGVNVTRLITDFGDVGIVLSRAMPKDQILLFRRDVVHLVEQPTPGKGNFFFEELAKAGAGKKGEIFGQVGLNYGPEWLHGKITNLTTE